MKTYLCMITACFLLGMSISPALSATYYVDANHPLASDGNAGTAESRPWKTISKANSTLQPGDTVLIKAGTYTNNIYPSRSGTAGSPITYQRYGTETVNISTGKYGYGVRLDARSYIVVDGLNCSNSGYPMYIVNGSHNTIANCVFDNPNHYYPTWAGSRIYNSSQYNWIHHCVFANYGYYDSQDHGAVLNVGTEEVHNDVTRYNLIENCAFYHGGHHCLGVYAMYNVLRNNYFHNEPWSMGTSDSDRGAVLYGNRTIEYGGWADSGGRNLIEGNRIAYSSDPSDDWGADGLDLSSSSNIVRSNYFYYNDVSGLSMHVTTDYQQDIRYNKIYNNTFFKNTINPESARENAGISFAHYSGSWVVQDNALKNNLLYKHRKTYGEYNSKTSNRTGIIILQIWANNYDGDALGNPQFINAPTTPGDPFDAATPDLRLQPTSPCKDYGTYLTKITTAGGTGTSFQVEDAGYFMDGWGVPNVEGDMIQLFGTRQKARITNVNYDTNWITLDRSVTWTQGQGVSLPYNGAAPDAGAFEIADVNAVVGFDVQKGLTGRSFIRYVDVTFQSADGLPDLIANNRVKLTRYDLNGTPASAVAVSLTGLVSANGNQLNLDFGPKGLGGVPNTTQADGYYDLTLDLDGDGQFETHRRFYCLMGDVDGDRNVTVADANRILKAYRQQGPLLNEDANGDGSVSALDRTMTARNLNQKLKDGLAVDD